MDAKLTHRSCYQFGELSEILEIFSEIISIVKLPKIPHQTIMKDSVTVWRLSGNLPKRGIPVFELFFTT